MRARRNCQVPLEEERIQSDPEGLGDRNQRYPAAAKQASRRSYRGPSEEEPPHPGVVRQANRNPGRRSEVAGLAIHYRKERERPATRAIRSYRPERAATQAHPRLEGRYRNPKAEGLHQPRYPGARLPSRFDSTTPR